MCSIENCHHVYGCLVNNTDTTHAILSGEKLLILYLSFIYHSVYEIIISINYPYFKGEHYISTRPTEQVINTSDVSSTSTLLISENSVTKGNFNRFYLLTGIGIIFLTLVIITSVHIYQKRGKKLKRGKEVTVRSENDKMHLPLDSIYHDIGECLEMMQTAGCRNISRTIERPDLPSRSRNSSYTQCIL